MTTTMERLRRLSAAEEFFVELGVAFEQSALNVHRLHILKRFEHYLQQEALDGAPDAIQRMACRTCLQRAYDDFLSSDAARSRKDFRVFQPHGHGNAAFVPLQALARGGRGGR